MVKITLRKSFPAALDANTSDYHTTAKFSLPASAYHPACAIDPFFLQRYRSLAILNLKIVSDTACVADKTRLHTTTIKVLNESAHHMT
jgi:hypothetical protein